MLLLVILFDSEAREPKREGESTDFNGGYPKKRDTAANWHYALFDFVGALGALSLAGTPWTIPSSQSL
ncbi:hypothetical protein H6F96_12960 [Microcoleus sp. FACHB-53]|nr:hypothetical protein [Microcoleus sp. FACHB-53]